jgi:hypothetical protein
MTGRVPRRWSEVTAAEARALFDEYLAGRQARLVSFLDEVRARGGPIERLDFGRESLGPLWVWIMATFPPTPATDGDMWASDPPWWYPFHSPLGMRIGPDLSRIAVGAATYFAETVLRTRPGSTWSIGGDPRSADYRQPLLAVAGRAGFLPDSIVLVAATQWASGTIVSETRLVDLYDIWAGPDGAAGEPAAGEPHPGVADRGPYSVGRINHPNWSFEIDFDDIVAWEEESRIERLIAGLNQDPSVDAAVLEDREVVLVRARLGERTMQELVDRLWSTV